MTTLDERWLARQFPNAFTALPKPYQHDSCLLFWVDDYFIYARPKPDQTLALGTWTARYNQAAGYWEEV